MTRRQAPQEKKARDKKTRVDMFGENQKSSRKNIARKQTRLERAYRHQVRAELGKGEDAETGTVRRGKMYKWAGPTLEEAVERKLSRRSTLSGEPRRTEEVRLRRSARRRRKTR